VGSGVLCGSMQKQCLERRNTAKSVESRESAVGIQTHWRWSQTVAPAAGTGGGGDPHCYEPLHSSTESCCEIDASLQGCESGSMQAMRDVWCWECCQVATSKDTAG
jgi:hypothetical protein